MKAVRCIDHKPCVVDLPEPHGAGIRVRIASAGICGSDLHLLGSPLLAGTLGHEFAGWLDDGTAVAVEPLDPCWQCNACTQGDYHRCQRGPAAVLGVGRDGGMAQSCIVPTSAIVPLASGLAPRDACLVEPLAVAVHGLRRAALDPRESILVIGAGPIGLCAVACARAAGARVDLLARHAAQQRAGERLGAQVVNEIEREYALVVEAAGTASALTEAVQHTRAGGRVLLLATYWEAMALPAHLLSMKEVTLVPSFQYNRDAAGTRDIERAALLLAGDTEIATALITHRFPLEAAAQAFAVARDRAAGAIKVVLEP